MIDESVMTIREMCDEFDVTPRTLRFYEAKELIAPIRRGTRRLFTKKDRARLKLILRGKRFGFSLEDIRQLLDLYDSSNQNLPQMEAAFELAQRKLTEMEQQRDDLVVAIEELREQIDWGAQMIAALKTPAKTAAG